MLSPASVLVTGANRGIGIEFVRQLVKLSKPPQHVFAACRDPTNAKELRDLAAECKTITLVKIDLNDLACLDEAVRQVEQLSPKGLNLLINNAAMSRHRGLEEVTAKDMVDVFTVNAVGPLMVIKAFLPLLRKAAGDELDINVSSIVNISTAVASIAENDKGGMYPYRTSKAALNMITKNLSLDIRKDNILVNALHPGWVKTNMGGPRATTETADSVKKMLDLMATWRGEGCHGKFYHFSGREMAW